MERYLEGEELGVEEVAHALKDAVTRATIFPVACGVATKNVGTTALLDLLVEGVPSPARKGATIDVGDASRRRSSSRRSPTRSRAGSALPGSRRSGHRRLDARDPRTHAKERLGQVCSRCRARSTCRRRSSAAGDIGAVAKLKETQTGDLLARLRGAGRAAARSSSRRR